MIELDVNGINDIIGNLADQIRELSIQNAVLKTENATLRAQLNAIEEEEAQNAEI